MRVLPFLLFALPGAAWAEGARLELDCTVAATCDATGACAASDDHVRFMVEPEAIDAEEVGLYTLWVDDAEGRTARGASRTGPFLWQAGDGLRMQLALTGDASAIWIRQPLGTGTDMASGPEIDLLTCEVTF
jgi:hypothetical protein